MKKLFKKIMAVTTVAVLGVSLAACTPELTSAQPPKHTPSTN